MMQDSVKSQLFLLNQKISNFNHTETATQAIVQGSNYKNILR